MLRSMATTASTRVWGNLEQSKHDRSAWDVSWRFASRRDGGRSYDGPQPWVLLWWFLN